MALDFPASPSIGEVYDRWQWDGDRWILTAVDGGGAAPSYLDYAVVGVTTTVSVPHQTNTFVIYNSYLGGNIPRSAGNQGVEVEKDGVYLITSYIEFTESWPASTQRLRNTIYAGAESFFADIVDGAAGHTAGFSKTVATPLSAGDVVSVQVWQQTGSTKNLNASTRLSVVRLDSELLGSTGFTYYTDTDPLAPATGETWYKPSTGESFVRTIDAWVLFGGGGGGGDHVLTGDPESPPAELMANQLLWDGDSSVATPVQGWDDGWQSFTPVWTNLTVGAGAVNKGRFRYCNPAKTTMQIKVTVTLDTNSSVGSAPYFAIPDGASGVSPENIRAFGVAWFLDANGVDNTGSAYTTGGSSRVYLASSAIVAVNATNPFTWASSDQIMLDITTEVVPAA